MDTVGSSIDKLMTVNLKTFYNLKSGDTEKLRNLDIQRNKLQIEISELLLKIFNKHIDDNDVSKPQYKTY